ncbi:MAG: CPBP family intramembrane metalloprotease [Actinomycetota bacterium]|nr:CPBP family intramembrane metalloprotease [Actinomycetota bacterium]
MPVPSSRRATLREAGRAVDVPVAVVTWLAAFFVGQTISALVTSTAGVDDADLIPIPTLFAAVVATWVAYIAGAWYASMRAGSGDPVEDYRLRFGLFDLVGVPVGVLTQLVLVPVVYLPLIRLWPDVFTDERLEETAQRLVDRADGASFVLLVAMVCIGAPIVEEIVYRGMIQGSLAARIDQKVALLAATTWFALIHFRPVEYPGLFVFGLVAGASFLATGRLGTAIVTHAAFNVTGLALAILATARV